MEKINTLLLVCGAVMFLLLIGVCYWRLVCRKQEAHNSFLIQLISASGDILPNFYKDIQILVNKCYKTDSKLYAEFRNMLRHHSRKYMQYLEGVAQSTQFPKNIENAGLTDREKIVYLLLHLGFTNVTIGGLLGATPENIRSTKSRVGKKLGQKQAKYPI